MRKVHRDTIPVPQSLKKRGSVGARERAAAKAHFIPSLKNAGTPGGNGTSFTFSAYKEADVVEGLERLFHGKCAYCEHTYAAGSKVDVEHYRPKAGVTEDPAHGGYWWLAAEWTNLLPSCGDCNRARYYQASRDAHGTPQGRLKLGKGNAFPIRGPRRAMRARDNHNAEDPLLIDPTRRDPEHHLAWKVIDDASVVVARWHDGANVLDPYGAASIQTFGLNRQALIEDRTDVLRKMELLGRRLRKHVTRAAQSEGKALDHAMEDIRDDLDALYTMCGADQRYSVMAGDFVDTLIRSLEDALKLALP